MNIPRYRLLNKLYCVPSNSSTVYVLTYSLGGTFAGQWKFFRPVPGKQLAQLWPKDRVIQAWFNSNPKMVQIVSSSHPLRDSGSNVDALSLRLSKSLPLCVWKYKRDNVEVGYFRMGGLHCSKIFGWTVTFRSTFLQHLIGQRFLYNITALSRNIKKLCCTLLSMEKSF